MFDTVLEINDEFVGARVVLAAKADIDFIANWKSRYKGPHTESTNDMFEYVDFAVEKWKYYADRNRCPNNWETVAERLQAEPECELGALWVLKCDAVPNEPVLGFAFTRRTWANNLVVDFLSKSPFLKTVNPRVEGAGSALFEAVVRVADNLVSDKFWAEATVGSKKFYRDELEDETIKDIFILNRERYLQYLDEFA